MEVGVCLCDLIINTHCFSRLFANMVQSDHMHITWLGIKRKYFANSLFMIISSQFSYCKPKLSSILFVIQWNLPEQPPLQSCK